MNKLDKILDTVNGFTKIVPAVFKDASGNLSSKRAFKLLGGGYLMIEGVNMITSAEEVKSPKFIGGCVCVLASVAAALILKSPDFLKGEDKQA